MKLGLAVLTLAVLMGALSATLAAADEPRTGPVVAASAPVGSGAPHLDLSSVGVLSPLRQSQDDWRRQYDAARARKSAGKKKMFIGLALDGAGVAIVFLAANDCLHADFSGYGVCSGNGSAALLGGAVAAGGGIVFIWGVIEYIDANGEVRALEARRPAGQTSPDQAAIVPLSEHQALTFAVGRRSVVGYRIGW